MSIILGHDSHVFAWDNLRLHNKTFPRSTLRRKLQKMRHGRKAKWYSMGHCMRCDASKSNSLTLHYEEVWPQSSNDRTLQKVMRRGEN
jgi:hypothetical protein